MYAPLHKSREWRAFDGRRALPRLAGKDPNAVTLRASALPLTACTVHPKRRPACGGPKITSQKRRSMLRLRPIQREGQAAGDGRRAMGDERPEAPTGAKSDRTQTTAKLSERVTASTPFESERQHGQTEIRHATASAGAAGTHRPATAGPARPSSVRTSIAAAWAKGRSR